MGCGVCTLPLALVPADRRFLMSRSDRGSHRGLAQSFFGVIDVPAFLRYRLQCPEAPNQPCNREDCISPWLDGHEVLPETLLSPIVNHIHPLWTCWYIPCPLIAQVDTAAEHTPSGVS